MKNLFKKEKLLIVFSILFLSLLTSNIVVIAYPYSTYMDDAAGFAKGSSKYRQIAYYQYGGMNWSNAVTYGAGEINANPAAISCSTGSSYNDANIVVSSNYWPQAGWSGQTNQTGYNYSSQKKVYLNSSKASGDWLTKGIATHEFCHCWGVTDCEDGSSIACGRDAHRNVNYITSDVTNLFKARYN